MNKAVTEGLVLMPPAFAAGLNLWSREDGLAGQGSWANQPDAAFVPADPDFAGCLEVQKTTATLKLRSFQRIPFQPGLYLRVTARVKCLSGALPAVRIAAFAAAANGSNVASADQIGPTTALSQYGQVVTVSAIIGSGNRGGVDMVWGTAPAYGHIGLDLTGATGGIVRIDDIVIEDATEVFHRNMMTWVDVRDFGARGDGVTDDSAAFEAADAAAGQRSVLVSAGTYRLNANVTFESEVRFEGTVTMPAGNRLACTRNFDLNTYTAAFGSEEEGFRRALHALFFFTDHVEFDMSGRRVSLTAPIDLGAITGLASFHQRRIIRNGQVEATAGPAWATTNVTSVATYAVSQPSRLTGVANIANIPVGAQVIGTGVGREVYVRSVNVAAGTLELSQPLFAAAGTRSFTFRRYRYLIDLSSFENLSRIEFREIEFNCLGIASGLMLPKIGLALRVDNCVFNRPLDRGITSIGTGCQGLMVDGCQFQSNELDIPAQTRTTIALNVNANDAKLRNNRVVRFAHFAILGGSGHIILGNHFFQGDDQVAGLRRAGIVFTSTHARSLVTGNYVDNCFLEWSNEHDPEPGFGDELSFGGLTITGNTFMAIDVSSAFRWIVVTPRGPGHFINGLIVSNNAFRVVNGSVERVEAVDDSFATLDFGRMRNVTFDANAYHSVSQYTVSPLILEHSQTTVSDTWVAQPGAFMPFGSRARVVTGLVPEGAVVNGSNVAQFVQPHVMVEQGSARNQIHVKWPAALRGRVQLTVRCDNPT
ncbi:glycosyl hydrolase family 28-related protein [Tabrizicola sp. M-4]|uniref:glycosyl hydrolase family 28-related protein n=1 Tax=Tabrizicola sp. M-4 TaxID=3055847 RepID=UPI003DA9F596